MTYQQDLLSPEELKFRELIIRTGLPLKKLPQILEASALEALNWWSKQSKLSIKEKHFNNLSQYLGINEVDLIEGSFDLKLAKYRAVGSTTALPDRYQENQNSFVRTSEHIHKYLNFTRGKAFADQVYTELNVSTQLYANPELPINLTYFGDLLDKLVEKGLKPEELDTLASVIFLTVKNRPLGKELSHSQDYHDVYQTLSKNFTFFDSNFECESQFIGKKYILTTTLPLKDHTELIHERSKIERLLRYRQICIAWIPYIAGLTPIFPSAQSLSKNDLIRVRYELRLNTETMPLSAVPFAPA